jgi:hypothetical protein
MPLFLSKRLFILETLFRFPLHNLHNLVVHNSVEFILSWIFLCFWREEKINVELSEKEVAGVAT